MFYMMEKKYLFLFLLFLVFNWTAQAQSFYKERLPRNNSFAVGVGPSFIYADIGGQYSLFDFAINPALSLSYAKRINPLISLQATTGMQWIENGGNPTQAVINEWLANESAIRFSGQAYFIDLMPMFTLFPYHHHMQRNYLNFYGGMGIGVLQARTKRYYTQEENSREYIANFPTAYIPIRAGMSYRIGNVYDICLEGSMLLTFSDDLDGNQNWNKFNDHLFQIQFILKKYLASKSQKF
jgi:hypothetical protein